MQIIGYIKGNKGSFILHKDKTELPVYDKRIDSYYINHATDDKTYYPIVFDIKLQGGGYVFDYKEDVKEIVNEWSKETKQSNLTNNQYSFAEFCFRNEKEISKIGGINNIFTSVRNYIKHG